MAPTVLSLRLLTANDFAPYGEVLELGQGPARAINAGTSARRDLAAALDLTREGGAPVLATFDVQAQAVRGPWTLLERHRLGSQTFVPLAAADWVVLVGLGHAAPERRTFAAFAATGAQGITLHAGTWHHPLIALAPGRFLVIERAVPGQEDCDVATLSPPVQLLP